MTRYFIGIDNGSQSSKVTVFDEHGRAVCEGRQSLRPYATPRPGVVEHPDDNLWTSIGEASRQAMAGFPGDVADIVGVGLCTIRFCRAVLKADGTLAQPVMSWMDARVSRPYEHTLPEARYVTTSSGYISHRMTGVFRDTAANYAGDSWPLDSDTWQWTTDDTVLAKSGVPREMLFDLVMPGEVLGTVTAAAARHTGIPEGLPVVATANDKAVEALGCGLRSSDTLLVSLGTYVAGMTVGDRNVPDASDFWTNYACMPHSYLYESFGVRRGMWTVSWLRDLLGEEAVAGARAAGRSVEEHLNAEAAKVPPGCDGLMTVLDWLAPTDAPYRKGTILGFDEQAGPFPHVPLDPRSARPVRPRHRHPHGHRTRHHLPAHGRLRRRLRLRPDDADPRRRLRHPGPSRRGQQRGRARLRDLRGRRTRRVPDVRRGDRRDGPPRRGVHPRPGQPRPVPAPRRGVPRHP